MSRGRVALGRADGFGSAEPSRRGYCCLLTPAGTSLNPSPESPLKHSARASAGAQLLVAAGCAAPPPQLDPCASVTPEPAACEEDHHGDEQQQPQQRAQTD